MKKTSQLKKFISICMCLALLFCFSESALAAESNHSPLPADSDTTLGDVQQHFSPDEYEEMPEELKEEVDETLMKDVMRKGTSSGKIFGSLALVSIGILTAALATDKSGKTGSNKK